MIKITVDFYKILLKKFPFIPTQKQRELLNLLSIFIFNEEKESLFLLKGYALTETKTIVEKVNKGGGVIIDVEKRVTDTIGFEPVLKYFKDRNYKTMFKVPGVENTEFELEVGEVEKVQGLIVPTFRARTPKKNILKGMNESLVKQELEVIESDQIKGEYVSVGSLDEVTTGGNWPPSYDKRDGAKEE